MLGSVPKSSALAPDSDCDVPSGTLRSPNEKPDGSFAPISAILGTSYLSRKQALHSIQIKNRADLQWGGVGGFAHQCADLTRRRVDDLPILGALADVVLDTAIRHIAVKNL
jgi:hypothetical protein